MCQSKRQSAKEVVTNTTIGFIGSWIITVLVLYSIEDKTIAATITVIICTVWSLLRGYYLRRYFNNQEVL